MSLPFVIHWLENGTCSSLSDSQGYTIAWLNAPVTQGTLLLLLFNQFIKLGKKRSRYTRHRMSSFHRDAWKAVANYVACTKRAKLSYLFGQVILAHYVQPQESVFWQEVCSCPSTVECPPRVNPQIRDNKNRSGMSPGKAKVRKLLSCEGEEGAIFSLCHYWGHEIFRTRSTVLPYFFLYVSSTLFIKSTG